MAELKIKQVWNERGQTFFPGDIENASKRSEMGANLWDEEFNAVCVHRRQGTHRSHFKLKSGSGRNVSHKDQTDFTHNETIDSLVDELNRETAQPEQPLKPIKILTRTKTWIEKTLQEREIWSSHCSSTYRFYKDPGTRLMLTDTRSIQPDIIGVDTTRLNRTKFNPSIIIEVVNHHWPEPATWDDLVALSKINYIVLFYFVSKGVPLSSSWLNKAKFFDGQRELVCNSILHQGVFHQQDETHALQAGNQGNYQVVKELAMGEAKSLLDKQLAKIRG
ncbi:hypothetical protein [Stenotrophomonas rhizophila]